jgi:hypothetical protein
MTTVNVPRRSVAENLSDILDSSEIADLIEALEATRETGRPGYSGADRNGAGEVAVCAAVLDARGRARA